MKRLALLPLVAALVAGCGGEGAKGTASVWVTRDRGAQVLLVKKVPAGTTAMQALDRVADIETRYGGRFVQSINGIEGSLSARSDWFYFVNGYWADRSAAEYVLRPGDVEWWDLRPRENSPEVKVVVGAFPEPFLHGYNGKRRPALVMYTRRSQLPAAKKVAGYLDARVIKSPRPPIGLGEPKPDPSSEPNILILRPGPSEFGVSFDRVRTSPGDPVRFFFSGDYRDLLKGKYRYRYEVK